MRKPPRQKYNPSRLPNPRSLSLAIRFTPLLLAAVTSLVGCRLDVPFGGVKFLGNPVARDEPKDLERRLQEFKDPVARFRDALHPPADYRVGVWPYDRLSSPAALVSCSGLSHETCVSILDSERRWWVPLPGGTLDNLPAPALRDARWLAALRVEFPRESGTPSRISEEYHLMVSDLWSGENRTILTWPADADPCGAGLDQGECKPHWTPLLWRPGHDTVLMAARRSRRDPDGWSSLVIEVDPATNRARKVFDRPEADFTSFSASPDGRRLRLSREKQGWEWEFDTDALMETDVGAEPGVSESVSPDGTMRVLIDTDDGTVDLIRRDGAPAREQIIDLDEACLVSAASWSPDSQRFAFDLAPRGLLMVACPSARSLLVAPNILYPPCSWGVVWDPDGVAALRTRVQRGDAEWSAR